MTLVIIIGSPAVGKMTVGQALEKITDLRLFHNHMSLELINKFFDFGTKAMIRLDKIIRFSIFEEVAKSDLSGLIFTLVWDYNLAEDEAYIDSIIKIFKDQDPQVKICLVELNASLDKRLERNKTENRLEHKPSKRSVEFSDGLLRAAETDHRMVSHLNEFPNKSIFKINNEHMEAIKVAEMIKQKFDL